MDEKRYQIKSSPVLYLPTETANRLLALGDAECALLYLYILRAGGELLPAQAARDLRRSEGVICSAAERLRRAGLLDAAALHFLPGSDELPDYSPEDIRERAEKDVPFRALIDEAQRVMGHALSRPDLSTLFGIYDRFGMSPEVIMLLINHCADKLRRRYGEGRLPTMRAIETEAKRWAEKEIVTVEQAEEYLAALERLDAESDKLRRALQIIGREPTRTEREYMDKWLAMGYRTEALSLAYDRTVTGTGKLAWAYMNKIVQSWYEKGLFTVEEIRKGDSRPTSRGKKENKPTKATSSFSGDDDLDRLGRILNNKG